MKQCVCRQEKPCPINKMLKDKRGEVASSFANVTGITPSQHKEIYKLPASANLMSRSVLYRTANDPQPQMIPRPEMVPKMDRKWSPKLTANDPVKTWRMEWILWDWLQKRADYKEGTFFSRLLEKKEMRTLKLRSIYTRGKNRINL